MALGEDGTMAGPPNKIALCIGINYDQAAPGIPPLRFAEKDAQDLTALLAGRGFQVTTLLGAAATRRAVIDQLAALATAAADLCVLYLSGHGMHGTSVLDRDR